MVNKQKRKGFPGGFASLLAFFFLFTAALRAETITINLNEVFMVSAGLFFFFVFLVIIIFLALHDSEDGSAARFFASGWKKLKGLLTDSRPIEQENDILLNHDYDGIKELDNVLPPWWKYLFYATVVWAVIYMVQFHVMGDGQVQANEYNAEVKLAEIKKAELMASGAMINENTAKQLTDAGALFSGKETFVKFCAACHGQKGEGLVGPNLTDEFWIHGGGIKNVFTTVANGVVEKGMLAWKTQLKPKDIEEVSSYVLSLQGTNPPNGKAPQGNKWVPVADSTAVPKPDSLKVASGK